jgi:glutamate dehydrogenase (NADP+)
MTDTHANCLHYGEHREDHVHYVSGANIAGFIEVADAMLAQRMYELLRAIND